jgi:hypothetical protein
MWTVYKRKGQALLSLEINRSTPVFSTLDCFKAQKRYFLFIGLESLGQNLYFKKSGLFTIFLVDPG